MNNPKVSVIVNCFNGARTLSRALDSIQNQTFHNFEIVFWDNASEDNSVQIAKKFGGKVRCFVAESTTTLSAARRAALNECRGDFIAFLDVDDIWYPEKLALQVEALVSTNAIVCLGGVREVTPEGDLIRELVPKYDDGYQFENHLKQFDINMVTPVIRRSALLESGINFDPRIVASEEYNIFMKLALFGPFCAVRAILGEWTINEKSLTSESIRYWALDRRLTLDSIKMDNPGIENRYKDAFAEAYSRADYYEAAYEVSTDNWKGARELLRSNSGTPIYFFLWVLCHWKFMWRVIHNERLKRWIALRILRKSKAI